MAHIVSTAAINSENNPERAELFSYGVDRLTENMQFMETHSDNPIMKAGLVYFTSLLIALSLEQDLTQESDDIFQLSAELLESIGYEGFSDHPLEELSALAAYEAEDFADWRSLIDYHKLVGQRSHEGVRAELDYHHRSEQRAARLKEQAADPLAA